MTEPSTTITPADNLKTVDLTEWLIMHDFFDEDGPAPHQQLIEDFGERADALFAKHREDAERPLLERIEKLDALLATQQSRADQQAEWAMREAGNAARLEAALKFYAGEDRYDYDNDCAFDPVNKKRGEAVRKSGGDILVDRGERARQALGKTQ